MVSKLFQAMDYGSSMSDEMFTDWLHEAEVGDQFPFLLTFEGKV